jgi:uncharacterized peroxidase-related enzyme
MHDYPRATLEAPVRALCDFAVQVTREPAAVAQTDVDRLRAHGWDDGAIHDAIQTIAYFNYINGVADAVGIEEEPEWRTSLDGSG